MEKLRWSVGPDRSRRQAACRAAAQDRSRVQALRYERNTEESRLQEAIEDAAKYRAQMLPTELGDANALIVEEKEKLAAMRSVLQRKIPSSTSGRLAEYGRCDVDSCVLHKRTLESKAIHSDDGLMVELIGSRTHDPLSPDSNLVPLYRRSNSRNTKTGMCVCVRERESVSVSECVCLGGGGRGWVGGKMTERVDSPLRGRGRIRRSLGGRLRRRDSHPVLRRRARREMFRDRREIEPRAHDSPPRPPGGRDPPLV